MKKSISDTLEIYERYSSEEKFMIRVSGRLLKIDSIIVESNKFIFINGEKRFPESCVVYV